MPTGEDIIIALRRVKHCLLQVGDIVNFEITRPLIESVKLSRSRYEEELKENEQKEASKNKEKEIQNNSIQDIDKEIKRIEKGIEIADEAIRDGSIKLNAHLSAKKIDPEKLQADNSLIQMGLQRKNTLSEELSNLRKKKKAKTSSNSK